MKFRNILFLSFLFAAGFTCGSQAVWGSEMKDMSEAAVIESINDGIITHTVAKGETVYSIAAAYNTTVSEIYRLNPKAENGIRTGDKLQILKVRVATGYSNHQIEAKETMFSVARMYHISVDDLKRSNPGLDESSFSIGKTIMIPRFDGQASSTNTQSVARKEHRVQKGETLYSIGKANDTSVEALLSANPSLRGGGLKEGMSITIPSKQDEVVRVINRQEPVRITETSFTPAEDIVRVGILFPFTDDKGSVQKEKLAEYYEGFLIAVRELKGKGLNAEIYTFDTGEEKNTKRLESLLGTNEMNNMNLIIGGVSKQQIDMLAKFSKKTGIRYAIPFGSTKEIENTPTLFQMTMSHSELYYEIADAFRKKYNGYNIIFVSESGSDNDKSDFVSELKKVLTKSGVQFKNISGSSNLPADIKKESDASKKNVLVPTSSSDVTLRKVLASIGSLSPESVTLFGYPEWQTYTQRAAELHKYDASIYSIFFLNDKQWGVQHFQQEYKKWYNKDLINSYPKFGYLGYDAGIFFLTEMNKYGSRIENNISEVKSATLQSAVHFQRINDGGGFVNKGVYFVNYKTNSSIEKTDITK
ncbi:MULTISPECIES: LysM peptidoglycan-binding domain-containing protein [unclassified Dysgonomonas]|uniref:amino acid ABC transporter substrate-binding protein n=1 Tax=unclassified Dysgonomonas TaxID=2630389 RepID=UPI0024731BEA|nr:MULTISPECIES: LysM peptidoglycan-binding domain-containing protein [unclassified Dysgonomonas]